MGFVKKNLGFLVFIMVITAIGIFGMYSDYQHTYLLSINGRITGIRRDIKENMLITVSGKEYSLAHHWPEFQKNVEISDSIYKRYRDSTVILIKTKERKRIVCKLK